MAIYVVMEAAEGVEADGARRAVHVRDGFSFLALLFPAVWLLWHRLWIEGVLVLALTLCLASFGAAVGLGAGAATLLSLLVGVYVALEGPALRIAALRRRGMREWGVIRADSRDEAEMRYLLDTVEEAAERPSGPWLGDHAARPNMRPTGPAMGLLGYPAGR